MNSDNFLCLYSRPADPKRPFQFVPPVWVVEWEGMSQEFHGPAGKRLALALFNKIKRMWEPSTIVHSKR